MARRRSSALKRIAKSYQRKATIGATQAAHLVLFGEKGKSPRGGTKK